MDRSGLVRTFADSPAPAHIARSLQRYRLDRALLCTAEGSTVQQNQYFAQRLKPVFSMHAPWSARYV
jgi:hypothetical protein